MEMIADRSSAVLDVESDVRLCSIKVSQLTPLLNFPFPVVDRSQHDDD